MTEKEKIYHGDCIELMKRIPAESVDMIMTDPPYGINYNSNRTDREDYLANDKFEDWLVLIRSFLPEFKRILKPTACCLVFCGGGGGKVPTTAIFVMEAIKHLNLIQTLVWKKNLGLGYRYRPSYENITVLSKDPKNYNFYDKSQKLTNVIDMGQIIPGPDDHPTQKPVGLIRKLIKIHTLEDDIVLDPFVGSGTTAIACHDLGRRFLGFEIDEKFYKMAIKRLQKHREQLSLFRGY